MTVRLHLWHLAHRRVVLITGFVQVLAVCAICTAPQASAASNAAVLNWTGLKDSYGVPIGDYYLSVASITETITQAGPQVSWDPASWAAWSMHLVTVAGSHWAVASILTGEAGLFVGITAIALVILRITVSTYWLTVIGEIARALSGAVVQVTTRLGVLLIAIPFGVFVGVVTIRRGEAGRGWTMILIALTLPALSVAVFDDPAGEMYGPDGLLAFGRRVGFSVAEAATHNGQLNSAVDANGQVDSLTASLITHVTREPLSLFNFGHLVDRVGNCGAAWSAALRVGLPDGPVRAMAACGDHDAVAYAERLDGTNAWIGLILVAAAGMLGLFVVVSGWAVLKVSVKAVWTTVILLPALWVGAVPGAPQRRALEVVWEFFRHALEVMVYIVYVSVIALAIERLMAAPLPAPLGGTNPFAHVLMMGATSVAALFLLRHVRAGMAARPRERGVLSRGADVAVGMGLHAAFGGAASAGVRGVRSVGQRLRGGGATPWDLLDRATDARAVHGPARPGFDPILSAAGSGESRGPAGGSRAGTGGRDRRGVERGAGGGGSVAVVTPAAEPARGRASERVGRPGSGAAAARLDGDAPGAAVPRSRSGAAVGDVPIPVPPIAEPPRYSEPDVEAPVAQVTDDPVRDDGPTTLPPTTVDPITENDPGEPPPP
ncbi:MAG: hypothetical protein JWR32_73 [Mycobacterium sp.]|nr:hypothetical protein [Mycobacterium sp.]